MALTRGSKPEAGEQSAPVAFRVNGRAVTVSESPLQRLSRVLRDNLGLTGTKVGCDAGDCGACTVLLDGDAVCACLVALGQVEGCEVTTVEGLALRTSRGAKLQQSFLAHGAAQCGACTPGMLLAAAALLEKNSTPRDQEVKDAIGGVLCRCTGYQKIIAAILDAGENCTGLLKVTSPDEGLIAPEAGAAVGTRLVRLDGKRKVDGSEIFGADDTPAHALAVRAIRSPYHRARFQFGDLAAFVRDHPGIETVFTAKDVPGRNCYGVIGKFADQPVFAEHEVRYRGEAVAAIVGETATVEALDAVDFPVKWEELEPLKEIDAALAGGARLIHESRLENVLVRGRVVRGDVDKALNEAPIVAEGEYDTGFVEHAYIEPEAGFARRVGEQIEIQACTQSPYMDRGDIAAILGIAPEQVRIIPSAVGGGFGSKLDLSVQPFSPSRHGICGNRCAWFTRGPSRWCRQRSGIRPGCGFAEAAAEMANVALDFAADFNTGAYSSWGPTVAARVPVHASGPYYVPHYRALTRAVHTHLVPAGAFRGFGVPQAAIAQEQLYDELADRVGMDRLEFRIFNALDEHTPDRDGTGSGSGRRNPRVLRGVAREMAQARREAAEFNLNAVGPLRRGVGVAGMWYGCGNTSLPNPSTMRIGLKRDGRIAIASGRGGYWPGFKHDRDANLRRCTGRSD